MRKLSFFILFIIVFNIYSYAEDDITYYGLSNGDTVISNINFRDLQNKSSDYWSKPAIYQMAAFGVISGFTDKTFLPSSPVTNEQAITLILNSVGKADEVNKATNTTNNDSWSDKYIRYAMKNGIVTEKIVMKKADIKSSTSIDGLKKSGVLIRDIPVTREEAAGMVSRALNLTGTKELSFYDKSQISDFCVNYVKAIVEAGIMSGRDDNMFNPKASLTREEMAQILKNAEEYIIDNMKLIKKKAVIDSVTINNIVLTDDEGNNIDINVIGTNIPVLKNGTISGKTSLKANDEIEYYIDLNKQVKFIKVIDEGISSNTSKPSVQVNKSIQCTVVSNSPYFEQITVLDKNGVKSVYSYSPYTEFYKDNIQVSPIDIVAGDTVYIELDEIENVNVIRSTSNYTITYGTIIKINGSNITIKSEETDEERTYNTAGVPIYKEGIEVSYMALLNGEYAKIYSTDTILSKIEIVEDERTLYNLYKGTISDVDLLNDTITLKNTEKFENNKWIPNETSFITIPLDKYVDISFYNQKINVSELGEKQVGKFAYIAAREDNKVLYKARKINIDIYEKEKFLNGNVKSYDSSDGKIRINNNSNYVYTDDSTIFIENNKIIDIPNISKNNKLFITAKNVDGEYIATVVNIAQYEDEKNINIYSGLVYDIEDNKQVMLRVLTEFYDDELTELKRKYTEFNLTNNTRIFTQSGPINLREFTFDNEEFDFEGMLVYLVAEGDEAIVLTTFDMEEPFILKGIINKVETDTITLKSVESYDIEEDEWKSETKKTFKITDNTVIIKNGETVKKKDVEQGQEILIFKNSEDNNLDVGILVIKN